ncbi:DNA oxidative demethylase AlkB [Pseudidiomarina insulisalsae]|uniref:DNA oxidative demethylase AlkB n=1 Tax=Pseudidiomarina insulisalsae TaxID=575789 RepID=A0A432YHQ4_9GAMM|nr:DNA oxidative demethylase AlkB [Pseudidiomarina insulisalsae]RUO60476.1 DNA oxidative demethylase AlkB [Pseudidiomarina insulisalsae]
MQRDLFATSEQQRPIFLGQQAAVLKGFALAQSEQLWQAIQQVVAVAPWRQLHTPGGRPMSVRTSNCGDWGWHSDRRGYRYVAQDPLTALPWPALPACFLQLAQDAARQLDFHNYQPDACLLNSYRCGTRMGLHQDRDEADLSAPIVSVSLGLPAEFLWGGLRRNDRSEKIMLEHGDVVVWGGVDRLRFHGVKKVVAGEHPLLGEQRINLTFRQAKS